MSDHKNKPNINQKFQRVYDTYKHNHKPDFELKNVFEIYLPFWSCRTSVVVEKDLELDRFSKIILQLVQSGTNKHSKICAFLGVDTDSFVTTQFHFLIKHGLLSEELLPDDALYSLTHEGVSFLEKKSKIKNLETVEFEYYVNDLSSEFLSKQKFNFHTNDLTGDYVDTSLMMDGHKVSQGKRQQFSGYQVLERHRLPDNIIEIPHRNKPYSINKVDFANFFNKQHRGTTFYDLEDNEIEAHKRSICFVALEYEDASGTKRYDIRHIKKTVQKFSEHAIEETLSKRTTDFLKKSPLK